MTWHSPFDLSYWLVNVFAGNMTIFLAIAFAVIAGMSAMFRMPNVITGFMFLLFLIMLSLTVGNLYIVAILILAVVVGWSISRLFKNS